MNQFENRNELLSGSLLCYFFKAGNTDAKIKRPLPKAPRTKALGTPPTFLIIKEDAGHEKAQTIEMRARL